MVSCTTPSAEPEGRTAHGMSRSLLIVVSICMVLSSYVGGYAWWRVRDPRYPGIYHGGVLRFQKPATAMNRFCFTLFAPLRWLDERYQHRRVQLYDPNRYPGL